MEMWIIDLGVANQAFNMAPVHKIPVFISFIILSTGSRADDKSNVLVPSEHSATFAVEPQREASARTAACRSLPPWRPAGSPATLLLLCPRFSAMMSRSGPITWLHVCVSLPLSSASHCSSAADVGG